MTENEQIGVIIVGTGLIARFHANAVKASAKLRLAACVDAFADSLAGGRPYPIDGANARQAIDLITRIYEQA